MVGYNETCKNERILEKKVIDLDRAKKELSKTKKELELIKYYQMIDYNGLILEAYDLIYELKSKKSSLSNFIKAKYITEEIAKRTLTNSGNLPSSFKETQKKIHEKLKNIQLKIYNDSREW